MDEKKFPADLFEANRPHLKAVAYRMLGSQSEAEDAVQEAWLRLSRSDTSAVGNVAGWLTTVVARICLDVLRQRKARREEPLAFGETVPEPAAPDAAPDREMMLADSVGLAMLVVLNTLAPAERIAFVLHDMFDLPFEEIGAVIDRSPAAARQLASRARRRVRGTPAVAERDLGRQRAIVDAFLAASRNGNFAALLAVLDPDVVARADAAAMRLGAAAELRGAAGVAATFVERGARAARPVLVDGELGLVVAPGGRLLLVLRLTFAAGRIAAIDAVADRAAIARLELAALD
jgi:RNA polymerase sigma factor (sigma-70 family)